MNEEVERGDTLVFDGIRCFWMNVAGHGGDLDAKTRKRIQDALYGTYWEPRVVNGRVFYRTFEYHIYERRRNV